MNIPVFISYHLRIYELIIINIDQVILFLVFLQKNPVLFITHYSSFNIW
ncbi:hypothetical protein HMPREF0645_1866 [Hallella bergensis DSM 17361]|uniref:Uncharacterized protein n=1 Tax=Hallella bergensis DSM 17361 TaxID=585502 RepID=D1PY31_9BACT|nr:hypothetical protein HMPREF0645_1866 [Hallella bergensis DSM 17361]